ncbi:MAG: Glucan endo,3-beta-glucosidase precursor [Pseudomonadota bacterium]|jgi:beta-glucanase (GH16 family)
MRISYCFALLVATLSIHPLRAETGGADTPAWALVWSDEFSGTELDRKKWKPEKSCWGGGNNERQCYTDRTKNIRVSGGLLYLTALEERFTGPDRPPEIASMPNPNKTQPFTSGKIRTRKLASWTYGKFEFRAKVPKGQGTWPAVWMMPADDHYGGWPLSGEIDILEAVNLGATCDECKGNVGENRTLSAIHFGDKAPKNEHVHQRVALPDQALPSDDFHIWTLEWGKGLMRFYLDNKLYWEVTPDQWNTASPRAKSNPVAPFDKPFYIMANLAIGGKLSEENNDKGIIMNSVPAEFLIDWIRVYQCKDDRESGLACIEGAKGGE